ncbi:hypothetical protein [Jiangella endophytica]|uniref:hypothetical protein n=1 Tax=Jiangella endophytica TaxID=1623398 RepID=UPI000E34D0CC|nr:hypothetical protein [Jiangella endophytica]
MAAATQAGRRPLPAIADRRRLWFGLDAVVTAANGAGYLALAGLLDGVLGAGVPALRAAGAFLLGFGLLVGGYALRRSTGTRAGWVLVTVNAAWVVASLVVAAAGPGDLTTAGRVWIVLQALVVGGLAVLQAGTLRTGPQRRW